MKKAAVILNYNDWKGTVSAVRRIDGFLFFDNIIIVDNASTDGSAERIAGELMLRPLKDSGKPEDDVGFSPDAVSGENHVLKGRGRITLIKAPRNGGYGYGNNLGVRYAKRLYGSGIAVIANPDSVFDEELLLRMEAVFLSRPDAGAVGAVAASGKTASAGKAAAADGADGHNRPLRYTELINSGWKRRGLLSDTLNAGPVCRRIFRHAIHFPMDYYRECEPVQVHAVHGSLVMVSVRAFTEAGGYDTGIFLYGEENVLGERMKRAGYATYLAKSAYRHLGAASIRSSGNGALKRQRLRQESERYYYRKYLKAGKVSMYIVGIFQKIVLAETFIAEKLGME